VMNGANYGGREAACPDTGKAKAVIVPVPYQGTVTYKNGTAKGPAAILEASANMELFDEELNVETHKIGIHTLPALEVSEKRPEEVIGDVERIARENMQQGRLPVVIGGEHSISVGGVRAGKVTFGELSVLHLDAHADLRDEYEGSKYSHACASRRMQEIAPVTQLGVRSMSKEERDFLSGPNNITLSVSAYDILNDSLWDKKVLDSLSEKVYVTIDLDVLDISIMPAVGTPEPGGLSWYLLLDILRMVGTSREIVGFDVVELSPMGGNVAPDFLASKLIYRFLGYIFFGRDRKNKKV